MSTKVAINGLGRIGRAILKLVINRPELEVAAVADLTLSPRGRPAYVKRCQ